MSVALKRDVARLTELSAQGLDSFGGPFLAGSEFTVVDAFFAPMAFRVRTYGLDVGHAGQEWVPHMLERHTENVNHGMIGIPFE